MKVYTVDCWKQDGDYTVLESTKYFAKKGDAEKYEYYMNQSGFKSRLDTCTVLKGHNGYFRLCAFGIELEVPLDE